MKRFLPEILLLLLGALLRVGFALLPFDLLLRLLEDDAWMVTAIARNWALGQGITADGLHPTNGFHPLYPLTLGALPYLIWPTSDLAHLQAGFRASLLLCALLNTLALLPLYGLLRAVAERPLALAGLAIVALNPFLVRVSVNAMETSLALLLLLTLWWYLLTRPPAAALSLWQAGLAGGLAGLAILARLDSAIAAGFLGLWLLWQELRQRRLPTRSLLYGGVAGVLLLPYFARNLLVFESLSPSSGRALAYMHSYRESFAFTSGLQLLAYQPAIDLTWAPVGVLAAALVGGLLLWLTLPAAQRGMLTPPLLYALTLACYYGYLQQQGRPRYYVAVAAVVVLLLCAWVSAAIARRWLTLPAARRGVALVAAVVVLCNSGLSTAQVLGSINAPYQAQPAMYEAARWIAANLPPDARLAAQNSGIFQYYSGRVVLNADGKLNHEIIPVLERRELDRYLRQKGIQYIVDLRGVGAYIEFYSSSMSIAEPHPEMSSLERLSIHARRVAHRLGWGPPVELAERQPERILRPFETLARAVQTFPLPNDSSAAVVVYRLHDAFGTEPASSTHEEPTREEPEP